MENRIYAPKQSKSIFIVGIAFFIFSMILSIFIVALTFSSEDIVASIVLSIIIFSFSASMLIGCLFVMNRECGKMWYDTESKEICREGYIKGFKHTVKIENIKAVCYVENQGGTYLITEENNLYQFSSKDKFIKVIVEIEVDNKNLDAECFGQIDLTLSSVK